VSSRATMRALQLRALNRLEEVEMPVPSPGPEEVLVQTLTTTICTSDLNDIHLNPFVVVNRPWSRPRSPGDRPRIRLVSWIVVVASCRIWEWPLGKWGEAVSRETTLIRLGP